MKRVLFIALLLLSIVGCKETVLHGIDEGRANQITLLLERAGIQSSKHPSGSNWDVRVEKEDLGAALRTIENSRILTRAANRFKPQDSSLIPSENQQTQVTERQISWAIEETLERIPGVVEAKVHLWLNKPTQFGLTSHETTARSASALLLAEPSVDLNAEDLRQLLNGATGAPLGAISVIIRPAESKLVESGLVESKQTANDSPPEFSPPEPVRGELRLKMFPYVKGLAGTLSIAATIFLILRRRRRVAAPKLSPAQLRKAASPLYPPISSGDHGHVQ